MPRKFLAYTALAVLLSGCSAQSRIQAKYITQEQECRDVAQRQTIVMEGGTPSVTTTTTETTVRGTNTNAVSSMTLKDSQYIPGQKPTTSGDPAQNAYKVGSAFSECMNKTGWKVAVPKPPGTVAVVNPPLGAPGPGGVVSAKAPPVVTPASPEATAPAVVAPPASATTPPTVGVRQPVPATQATPAAPISGPGVQPAPAPAFTAPAQPAYPQGTSGASTYQPARPNGADAPEYGSGAGRNF